MTNHERDDWGDDGGLRPLLDAYADARLRVDPAAQARARAHVIAEARAAQDARREVTAAPRRRPLFAMTRRPRLRLSLLAGASLLVALAVAGAAVAGSGPGGPFYTARLWVEELALPAGADARAEAQADHLDDRLAEAQRAAREGNGPAVTAALEAYRAAADAALANAGDDPTRRAQLTAQLGRHVAVLEALVPLVPGRASQAIQAAVDRTEARISEILAMPTPAPQATPRPDRSPPGKPEATPTPTPAATPAREATPKPEKSPPGKPDATPAATPAPEATPKPEKSPPGKPTPTPAAAPAP